MIKSAIITHSQLVSTHYHNLAKHIVIITSLDIMKLHLTTDAQ